MNILVLVNGAEGSADGLRAKALAEQLPSHWKVTVSYRGPSKRKSMLMFLRLALVTRPQVIVAVKMAYSAVFAGIVAKLLCRCALVCDTGDVAYELAKSCGRYSRLQTWAVWTTEMLGIHMSDHIITRGTYHRQLLAEKKLNRVTVIPDGVDTSIERPRESAALRNSLGLEGQFVIGLIGSMEWSERHQFCYGWDLVEVLQFVRDLPIAVLLVGDGNGVPFLENRAKELGVSEKVRFVGRQPYERLGDFLGVMHVCINTQSADLVGNVRTTGKLPLYLAHDKYVIATAVGEGKRVLAGVGTLLPYQGVKDPQHPRRLEGAVRRLHASPTLTDLSGKARGVAVSEFDYSVLGQRFYSVLTSLKR